MNEIKSPNKYNREKFSVFLAGSIEGGTAENWQDRVSKALSDFDIQILNPRRDDWDLSWSESIENEEFKKQVFWELNAQEHADLIVMYFDKNTSSPITLMELGLFIKQTPIIICCPEKFWKRGNVEIACRKYKGIFTDNENDFIKEITKRLKDKSIRRLSEIKTP